MNNIIQDKIQKQVSIFKKGPSFRNIIKPATNNEIITLTQEEINNYINFYEKHNNHLDIIKFVPASGAATRMFKDLYIYVEDKKLTPNIEEFYNNIKNFSFYSKLEVYTKLNNNDINTLIDDKNPILIEYLLLDKHLGYGSLPKALIEFHKDTDKTLTPIDEHVLEATQYAKNQNGCKIHFTISPQHEKLFLDYIKGIKDVLITYSFQKEETNTIAVDLNNEPLFVYDEPLFRPGGHGSLIENLYELNEEIIFIKNIDNVQSKKNINNTILYKKAMAGLGLKIQNKIYNYLDILEYNPNEKYLKEIKEFIDNELNIKINKESIGIVDFINILNRPLRICGMVINEGAPGGGPFIVEHLNYSSLQIVEKAEIDTSKKEHFNMIYNSTHFNPVDLVCFTKDYKGNKFNLKEYVDYDAYFITEKSIDGKPIKALENPGLWNGAMSKWNTIFVEVPISTFTPVKTINDLLKEEHQ